MPDSSGWFALIGALGGVTLTGILGLTTAGLNRRWAEKTRVATYRDEQTKAITVQRRQVCHDYLIAANSYWLATEQLFRRAVRGDTVDDTEHMKVVIAALQDAYVYLAISCGAGVRQLADTYNSALYAVHGAAREADATKWDELYPQASGARIKLRDAMRHELGVED